MGPRFKPTNRVQQFVQIQELSSEQAPRWSADKRTTVGREAPSCGQSCAVSIVPEPMAHGMKQAPSLRGCSRNGCCQGLQLQVPWLARLDRGSSTLALSPCVPSLAMRLLPSVHVRAPPSKPAGHGARTKGVDLRGSLPPRPSRTRATDAIFQPGYPGVGEQKLVRVASIDAPA